MARTLEDLDQRWSGAEPYLRQHGLGAQEVADLRTRRRWLLGQILPPDRVAVGARVWRRQTAT